MQCTCMRTYVCLNIFVSFFCFLLHAIIEAKHSSPDYVQSLPPSLIDMMLIFCLTENKQTKEKAVDFVFQNHFELCPRRISICPRPRIWSSVVESIWNQGGSRVIPQKINSRYHLLCANVCHAFICLPCIIKLRVYFITSSWMQPFCYLIYFITSNCYQVTGFISWFNGDTALTDKRLKKK